MNGEAITKRYEVRDPETGELVDEPLYVLRPRSDQLAKTAMFVYAHLCGIHHPENMLVATPKKDTHEWQTLIREVVEWRMDPVEFASSGLDIEDLAKRGSRADGSVDYLVTILGTLGLEVNSLIVTPISEERKEEAKKRLKQEFPELEPEDVKSEKEEQNVL